jgi:Tfp pilus assembly protein PilF
MRRNQLLQLMLLVCLAMLLSHCAASKATDQLQFGIQSAKRELWDEAVFRWKKVVMEQPGSAAAHNNLAVAYEKKGLWEEAKAEYELATKLKPRNEYIQANYEKFIARYESRTNDNDNDDDENEEKKDVKKKK